MIPISHLHRELLHYVLQLVLSDQWVRGAFPPSPFPYYATLFRIRQVSHAWDHEILSTSLFWTLVSPRFHPSFQDLIWERSGDAALEVDVSRRPIAYAGHEKAYWTEPENHFLARVMTREIRGVRARVPVGECFVPHFDVHDHPRMSFLALYGEHQFFHTRPLRTPRLAELHLVQCSIMWDRFRSLRSLSISGTRDSNLLQLVQILQSSPLLEYLNLDRIVISSENSSNTAMIPPNPINLPRLSTVAREEISFNLASGLLENLFPSDTCRVATTDIELDQGLDLSSFCHHTGRVCIPRGLAQQVINPRVYIIPDALHLQLALDLWLHISVADWSDWEQQSTMPRRIQLARTFFEGGKGVLSKTPISQFYLRADSVPVVAEGLAIAHEFFPEIVGLDVSTEDGLEALEALAEPMTEEGNPVWLLPNLSSLKMRVLGGGANYGRIIAMAIRRTQAASLSSGALSPITSLRFTYGQVQGQILNSLDESGITYELDSVVVL